MPLETINNINVINAQSKQDDRKTIQQWLVSLQALQHSANISYSTADIHVTDRRQPWTRWK